MPFSSLLMLALLLPASGPASQPAASAASVSQPSQPSTAVQPDTARDSEFIAAEDDICYKIRAYIFQRDDDHAPQFVRSTTCGPRKPHTKSTNYPKAKLVPAN